MIIFICIAPFAALQNACKGEIDYAFLSYLHQLQMCFTLQQGKTNLSHDGLNPAHVPCQRVNNPTLSDVCDRRIGRADIEGSKSDVAENAWPPQASYPCGNFSDTSSLKFKRTKGSIGHAFTVCIRTENQNQASFSPFGPHEISVLIELTLGHLRYHLTDVPPQPNSPPDYVFRTDQPSKKTTLNPKLAVMQVSV